MHTSYRVASKDRRIHEHRRDRRVAASDRGRLEQQNQMHVHQSEDATGYLQ